MYKSFDSQSKKGIGRTLEKTWDQAQETKKALFQIEPVNFDFKSFNINKEILTIPLVSGIIPFEGYGEFRFTNLSEVMINFFHIVPKFIAETAYDLQLANLDSRNRVLHYWKQIDQNWILFVYWWINVNDFSLPIEAKIDLVFRNERIYNDIRSGKRKTS